MASAVTARKTAVLTASAEWTPENDAHPPPEKPVLILDQFEDVFKASFNRRDLWEPLGKIVNVADAQIHVVVSMREEWLGAWAESIEYLPDNLRSAIRLSPLTSTELARAIVQPALSEGTVTVDPGFAALLIADLGTPNEFDLDESYVAAGLVQLVCQRLWDEAASDERHMIDWALYKKLGGIERIGGSSSGKGFSRRAARRTLRRSIA